MEMSVSLFNVDFSIFMTPKQRSVE